MVRGQFLEEKEMEFYRFHLEQILRYRDHTLSDKEEKLLAASSEMSRAARDSFDMLDNADLQLGAKPWLLDALPRFFGLFPYVCLNNFFSIEIHVFRNVSF